MPYTYEPALDRNQKKKAPHDVIDKAEYADASKECWK
jgi:hypothetical protein